MLLYALSIFLSAFLLFLVQPLIARIILPWFGGTASVWTTCLMFFQTVLLGGYFYSHAVARRLRPRGQMMLHMGLLAASVLFLPILPGSGWKPVDGLNPEIRILTLLAATVGVPYLLLSTTGPLVQAWYARAHPGTSPYRLYALSNAGSLLALLGYPAVMEPMLRIPQQAYVWSGAYGVFALLCGATAWVSGRAAVSDRAVETEPAVRPGMRRLALWAALAFCPSSLLVGITSHMTQNIAPIPLLWVIPLALYLVSFILTFESERWYKRGFWFPAFISSVGVMIAFLFPGSSNYDIEKVIPVFVAGFFCCAMICHGELYRLRPPAASLTWFYLMLSLGGALGGIFVGVISPLIFNYYYEVPVTLLITVILVAIATSEGDAALPGPTGRSVQWGLLAAAALGLIYFCGWTVPKWGKQFRYMGRNFYGVLRVEDSPETDSAAAMRELHHGSINHGSEFLANDRHREPTTYYGRDSGVGLALGKLAPAGPMRVGLIGLGAGTLAAYCRPGDWYRFYEINSMVVNLARTHFFFLKECPAEHSIVLGDARLSLEREPPQNFDLLAVDAFSGDSIPVHLLTAEAFREYQRHLKPNGMLAVHVSNRYLALRKVVARVIQDVGLYGLEVQNEDDDNTGIYQADWVMLSRDPKIAEREEWKVKNRVELEPANIRLWTDDYSTIIPILK